jgi:hypothetical protein
VKADSHEALTDMRIQDVLKRRRFVQASGSMPPMDTAVLAAEDKLPTRINQPANIAKADLFEVLKDMRIQVVLLHLRFVQASRGMPIMDTARLAVEAKLPTRRNQAANIVIVDLFEALTVMEVKVVLKRRMFARRSSMPIMDTAHPAPPAQLATAREPNAFNNSRHLHEAMITKRILH